MAGSQPPPGVAVEVLVEQDRVACPGYLTGIEAFALKRTPSLGIRQKQGHQTPAQLRSDFPERM
jgi:hypothetical protein